MANETFTGKVLGGPLGGTDCEKEHPEFTYRIVPERSPLFDVDAIVDPYAVSHDIVVYRHVKLYARDDMGTATFGVWVPEKHFAQAHRYIYETLLANYQEPVDDTYAANSGLAEYTTATAETAVAYINRQEYFAAADSFSRLASDLYRAAMEAKSKG